MLYLENSYNREVDLFSGFTFYIFSLKNRNNEPQRVKEDEERQSPFCNGTGLPIQTRLRKEVKKKLPKPYNFLFQEEAVKTCIRLSVSGGFGIASDFFIVR